MGVQIEHLKMKQLTLFFINLVICFLYDQKAESSYLLVKLENENTISDSDNTPDKTRSETGPQNNVTENSSGRRSKDGGSSKLRSGSKRNRNWIGSPLERDFCERAEWYKYPVNAHYDLCVVDCDGRRCTETAWVKHCGCKQDRPEQKGVMEYRDGRLVSERVKDSYCNNLDFSNSCRSCSGRRGWTSESYQYWRDTTCQTASDRCRNFDLEELGWTWPDGTPFTGRIDDHYCNERYDRPGKQESFCEVYCHYDGSCTETVKKKQCSCDKGDQGFGSGSEVLNKCATIEYQNGQIVGEFGDRGGESIEDLFYTCGNNDRGMRCQECNKDREDILRVARQYITYEHRSGRCDEWR